jgi:hypothetical protein
VKPDLDRWLSDPAIRVVHHGRSRASADELWRAATTLPLSETGRLGRLVRWRIPDLARDVTLDGLFRESPFMVLEEGEHALVSGLVGRIWTLRRDYPRLAGPDEFSEWSRRGTARVLFGTWAQADNAGQATLTTEARVQAIGAQGRVGVAAVRPIVRAFQNLVGSEGIGAAVRRAERGDGSSTE